MSWMAIVMLRKKLNLKTLLKKTKTQSAYVFLYDIYKLINTKNVEIKELMLQRNIHLSLCLMLQLS